MEYIKIDENMWVEVDKSSNYVKLINKSEIERLIEQEQKWLKDFEEVSEDELLSWAKLNHPTYQEKITHENTLKFLQDLLKKLK